MPTCLGCGDELKEVSRKKVQQPGYKNKVLKVVYQCPKADCKEKGLKKNFLEEGGMVIPLND